LGVMFQNRSNFTRIGAHKPSISRISAKLKDFDQKVVESKLRVFDTFKRILTILAETKITMCLIVLLILDLKKKQNSVDIENVSGEAAQSQKSNSMVFDHFGIIMSTVLA
jgi:hypothetical protein